ncbi:hypothetical protein [Bradyrhizobium sp. Gha]|uniref:hypothetical protein n=1 Tax=Bradyrhizobium sp. Gha TaxID=1855318 RepID=UPI0008F43DF3|nr:hypothetical protein [Bradyrhizobium sp. Gha]SFI62406.1 hypothetical protein SAMN05216525_11185 [Bradyrhizobium sp. Gha]
MSGEKLFSNPGQFWALVVSILSLMVAVTVNWSVFQQPLLASWPVFVVIVAVYFTYALTLRFGGKYAVGLSTSPPIDAVETVAPIPKPAASSADAFPASSSKLKEETFKLGDDGLLMETRILRLGDYWDIRHRLGVVRVTLRNVPREQGDLFAELEFTTGGSLIYAGEKAKKIRTNRFSLPASSSGSSCEDSAAFQFNYSNDHVSLLIVRVDHINDHNAQVSLSVCSMFMMKTPQR